MSPSNSSKTTKFSNIWRKFRSWIRYNFCFCRGVFFASGLLFSDKLIEYSILAVLITYLAEKELTNAAILALIQEGTSALLEIVMIFISSALFGRFLVISVSSLFYLIGLVLLYHGSIKEKKSRFDISGILLLAVGRAGLNPLIKEFIADQYRNHKMDQENPDEDQVIARKNVWCRIVWVFSAVASFLTYYLNYSWPKTYKITAWATGSSLALFLCGTTRFYHSGVLADAGSRLTAILHDLMAFLFRMRRRIRKQEEDSTYPNHKADQDEYSMPGPEERKALRKKKLKYFEKMGCMWTAFLLFGLVLSAGESFFPFQGEHMQNSWFLPLLVVSQSISRKIVSYVFQLILSKWVLVAKQRKAKLVRICLGMMVSIPCFLVAWRVEVLRLRKFTTEILPDGHVPMSIFYLVPQFCILGLMQGLAQDGLDDFMIDMFPESREDYVSAFNTFVIGLGNFGNTLCYKYAYDKLFAVEQVEGWSTTRMDKFFIIITIVGSVNVCYYLFISILFYYKGKKTAETPRTARSDVNDLEKDGRSQVSLDFNVEEEEKEGLDNTAAGEDEQRLRKANTDSTGEGVVDHNNPFKCLSDLLTGCF